MGNNKLFCFFCKKEISDISVANPVPEQNNKYCCLDCYIEKGVMSQKILDEIYKEEIAKKYGKEATSEVRVFGKK